VNFVRKNIYLNQSIDLHIRVLFWHHSFFRTRPQMSGKVHEIRPYFNRSVLRQREDPRPRLKSQVLMKGNPNEMQLDEEVPDSSTPSSAGGSTHKAEQSPVICLIPGESDIPVPRVFGPTRSFTF
jgi:hypothetical protein